MKPLSGLAWSKSIEATLKAHTHTHCKPPAQTDEICPGNFPHVMPLRKNLPETLNMFKETWLCWSFHWSRVIDFHNSPRIITRILSGFIVYGGFLEIGVMGFSMKNHVQYFGVSPLQESPILANHFPPLHKSTMSEAPHGRSPKTCVCCCCLPSAPWCVAWSHWLWLVGLHQWSTTLQLFT